MALEQQRHLVESRGGRARADLPYIEMSVDEVPAERRGRRFDCSQIVDQLQRKPNGKPDYVWARWALGASTV